MELANNLKQARLAKNMSQEELAAFIGKSKNVISSWEGNNSFSISITEQSLIKKIPQLRWLR